MDRVSKIARSRIMSLVKSTHGRTTERRLRAHLVSHGISGWTMNEKGLPGRPDFVFHEVRLIIFVDGCFWHGCTRCKRPPKTNVSFWTEKVRMNQRRDKKVTAALRRRGWTVIRVKECDLRDVECTRKIVRRIEHLNVYPRERRQRAA
jgi:DNA mismatch endonuclease (patch repair protein)